MRPVSTMVQRVPRRTQVCASLRRVSVFAESIANTDLVVPNRLEEVDEVAFSRTLPSRLDNKRAIFEVFYSKRRRGPDDILFMFAEAAGEFISLLDCRFITTKLSS